MAVPGLGQAFSISTPSATIDLPPNRSAVVPFTVTNLAGRPLRAKAIPRGLGDTPADWFKVDGDAEQPYEEGAVKQVRLIVDPALGAPARRYAFRLDVQGVENPTVEYSEGPECAVDVPASTGGITTARGYLVTLAGAGAGGALFLVILLVCTGLVLTKDLEKTILAIVIGILAFLAMWPASAVGIAIALRIRRYRGGKLTAVFFAVLIVPWTVLNLLLVDALNVDEIWIVFVLPLTLLFVPALLARALVLLLRTHRI